MPPLENPPLIEAIFEMRWGQTGANEFRFSSDEQAFLPGKINAFASEFGFPFAETLDDKSEGPRTPIPHRVAHRFRPSENEWPCIQLGLGVFTVNQIDQGYRWKSFKNSIGQGLKVLGKAHPEKLCEAPQTLRCFLRYQDAFYPHHEGLSSREYVRKHFHIQADLPDDFLKHRSISDDESSIHFKVTLPITEPEGTITVHVLDAHINNEPGILMDTIIESTPGAFSLTAFTEGEILDWCEKAHQLQKHTFETIIKSSAYGEKS